MRGKLNMAELCASAMLKCDGVLCVGAMMELKPYLPLSSMA